MLLKYFNQELMVDGIVCLDKVNKQNKRFLPVLFALSEKSFESERSVSASFVWCCTKLTLGSVLPEE